MLVIKGHYVSFDRRFLLHIFIHVFTDVCMYTWHGTAKDRQVWIEIWLRLPLKSD